MPSIATTLIVGCSHIPFPGFAPAISTSTPTDDQVQFCRKAMYIDEKLRIHPIGFYLQSGMDDLVRFKFIAETDDSSKLFDPRHVDSAKFKARGDLNGLHPDSDTPWWDVSSRPLTGENFVVPPGIRGLNVGYFDNGDETLTVFVLWHET